MKKFILFIATLPATRGFLFPEPMVVKPTLKDLINAHEETRLNIELEIGNEGDASRMAIRGMVLDLLNNEADYEHVKLPGANGPHPKLSTGARRLTLQKEGHFVGMKGMQGVKTEKGCWELVWKKDAPAGSLLCGFEVPEDYNRNDATLPKGRIYVSFPVWSKDGLAFGREKKEQVERDAKQYSDERDLEMTKVKETKNPLMKAMHLRNAYAAAENYMHQPLQKVKMVPDENEVIELQDDLFLTTKGLVWSKVLPRGKQTLLGTATVTPSSFEVEAN